MNDYSDIGLNDKLQAINGLSAKEQPEMERAYIPAPSINNPPGVISGTAGTAIVDGRGVVSTTNFGLTNTFYGTTQTFNGTSFVDFSNSSNSVTLVRPTRFLFTFLAPMDLNESVGNTGNGVVFLDINGTISNSAAIFLFSGNNFRRSASFSYLRTLNSGTYTIKLKGKMETINAGTPSMRVHEYTFHQIALGN